MSKQKILVVGASGVVGFAAIRHFEQLADWEVVGVSRRIPPGIERAKMMQVDLLDVARCNEAFGRMHDVTHVLYADRNWAYGLESSPAPTIVSTVKARQAGFHDCMDTEAMFGKWFRRYQELKWLPPRD